MRLSVLLLSGMLLIGCATTQPSPPTADQATAPAPTPVWIKALCGLAIGLGDLNALAYCNGPFFEK